jgi:hypothetical protein
MVRFKTSPCYALFGSSLWLAYTLRTLLLHPALEPAHSECNIPGTVRDFLSRDHITAVFYCGDYDENTTLAMWNVSFSVIHKSRSVCARIISQCDPSCRA